MSAHMFPSVFPEHNNSSGEKKVFNYFKQYAPDNWYILHSYRLPEHKRVIFGEADFVVIAPPYGIFILEIKSGGVGFDGTYWQFINRNHEITEKSRGPFEQAKEAMFEIKRIISDRFDNQYNEKNVLYYYGVIFTDEDNFPKDKLIEDQPWCLHQNDGKNDYYSFIKLLNKKFREQLKLQNKKIPEAFNDSDAAKIAKILRPIVDIVPPIKSFIDDTEQDIFELTQEQLECLDDIELNSQMLVFGAAGTGKTLIAIEDAKRSALKNKKTGIFCFNSKLGEEIQSQFDGIQNVEASSITKFLYKFLPDKIDISSMNNTEKNHFFNEELPTLACKAINAPVFDKIIIDEFQDICTAAYLAFFDKILKKGLCDGNFTFYGDFTRQAIFNKTSDLSLLDSYSIYAKKQLSVNCRNSMNVGNELVNISGFEDTKYKLQIPGEKVEFYTWKTSTEQTSKFDSIVRTLIDAKINPRDITVLAPITRNNSIIDNTDYSKNIIDYQVNATKNKITFSTIQSFKGLENKIIILIDITSYEDKQLMYVAFSRARSKLIVLESVKAKEERNIFMAKKLFSNGDWK